MSKEQAQHVRTSASTRAAADRSDRIAGTPPSEAETRALPHFIRILECDYAMFVEAYSLLPSTEWWHVRIGPAFAGLLQAAMTARVGVSMEPQRYRNSRVPMPAAGLALGMVNAMAHAEWWPAEGEIRGELAPLLWRYTLEDLALVLEDIRGRSGDGFVAHLIRDLPNLKCKTGLGTREGEFEASGVRSQEAGDGE